MLTLQIVTIVVLGAVMALLFLSQRKNPATTEVPDSYTVALDALDDRMRRLELKWATVQEELEDRLERGTNAFRLARQADAYRRRKAERDGDLEELEEPEELAADVQQIDAFGGDPRGLSYMRPNLGDAPPTPWEMAAKQLAAHLAGRGGN